jgi:hypothetical protein
MCNRVPNASMMMRVDDLLIVRESDGIEAVSQGGKRSFSAG